MSEWKVEVVRVDNIEKHPNADRLEIVNVHGGYPVIVVKGDFKPGDLAVYVPIDSLVPASRPEFAFLVPEPKRKPDATDIEWAERLRKYEREKTEKVRIRAKKLRGVFSMGLLVPLNTVVDNEAKNGRAYFLCEGDDVAAILGIEKYEPDVANTRGHKGGIGGSSGESERDPGFMPEFTDVEGLRKWKNVLQDGEEVVITEKIHGQNARYLYRDGRLWVGSHYQIKRRPLDKPTPRQWGEYYVALVAHFVMIALDFVTPHRIWRALGWKTPKHPTRPHRIAMTNWWQAASNEKLEQKLATLPGVIVYGEVYGPCQDLKYGTPDKLRFRAFAARDSHTLRWLDYDEFKTKMVWAEIETVPELYRGPWSDACWALAEGRSTLPGADHVREGIVILPVKERTHPRLGRVILKLVGEGYLLR